jgi:hypothetical protein
MAKNPANQHREQEKVYVEEMGVGLGGFGCRLWIFFHNFEDRQAVSSNVLRRLIPGSPGLPLPNEA